MDSRKVGGEDYVTIVSVGNAEGDSGGGGQSEEPFVTVLSIWQRPAEEEVTIYRLPGEKLGFGLKFEGGTGSSERVRRLFIQSCAPDSPAGRARAAWGALEPGDEILRIDCLPVTDLTRLECVRRLKDSNVAVTLLVRHDDLECALEAENKSSEETILDSSRVSESAVSEKRDDGKTSLPPPVPPRKLNKKNANGSNDKVNLIDSKNIDFYKTSDTVVEITTHTKKSVVGKQSPGRPRRIAPTPGHDTPPPEAQVYTDLFCQEKERGNQVAESESDDTGSSISTVIDRLSVYSSFPGSVENSIPSTPTLGYKQINLDNVFNCLDSVSLLSDIPPSIVEENRKSFTKSSNGVISTEKGINVNDTHKNSFKSDDTFSVISVNDSKYSTREIITEKTFIQECRSSDDNNNYSQKTRKINQISVNSTSSPKSYDVVDCVVNDLNSNDKKITMEAPKPKPRSINKKHPENGFSNRQFDDSLSLTKLHCIESWLQDSISCKNSVEESETYMRDEDTQVGRPEALPRLIDFVPKTHVVKNHDATDGKEKSSPASKLQESDVLKEETNHLRLIITRDPCQEWSNTGSSPQLETIYEDISPCPTLLIEESSRHPPAGDSGSDQGTFVSIEMPKETEIRTSENGKVEIKKESVSHKREDSEDCGGVSRGPRPPPDGRENPLVHHDDLPPPPAQLASFHREAAKSISHTPSKTNESFKDINRFEHSIRTFAESPRRIAKPTEKSYGRGKDTKSEGSVKDKIAMFSVNKTTPPEPVSYSADKKIVNNRVTEKVPDYTPLNRKYSLPTESIVKPHEGKDWFTSPKKVERTLSTDRPDLSRDYTSITKLIEPEPKLSPIVLLNMTLAATPVASKTKKDHQSTLDHLIEQRRKSMSKLRGLVIPDSQSVANLPEIKSRDSLKISSLSRIDEGRHPVIRPPEAAKTTVSSTLPSLWDNQSIIPKYSPAFKRKPLQVYGPKTSKTTEIQKYSDDAVFNKCFELKSPIPIKPPRTSLDMKRPFDREFEEKTSTLPASFKAPIVPTHVNVNLNLSPQSTKSKGLDLPSSDASSSPTFKLLKHFPETADSDDSSYLSTVSSPTPSLNTMDNTESDCSSHCVISQKFQHFSKNDMFDYGLHHALYQPDNEKTNVCRSLSSDTSTSAGSSNSSTLTSGSQASCSSAGSTDTGSHRVLKPRSIEAINRKNILASAKCRSGKDNKFGSPLIERKFSDVESTDDDSKQKPTENQYPKSRSEGGLANSILKVAYSTLVVEDKCTMNETDSTYSDTESDCDFGSVTLTKAELAQNKPKYTNGSSIGRKNNDTSRRSDDNYSKTPLDEPRPNRIIENGVTKNSKGTERRIMTEVSRAESIPVFSNDSKTCEYESYEASSCGASEDEQENRCEVTLARGASGGVGVTLAGGTDCEAKQVTIHKVLQGSAAERDGRLRKGDRVISINGHIMKGVTHAQSVAILKEMLPEVSIVVLGKRTAENPPPEVTVDKSSAVISIVLDKTDDTPGGAGLGISLQGGGSRPLLINRLFTGGAAANSGKITPGSELISVGESHLAGFTRTQAMSVLRGLPAGPITLKLRAP